MRMLDKEDMLERMAEEIVDRTESFLEGRNEESLGILFQDLRRKIEILVKSSREVFSGKNLSIDEHGKTTISSLTPTLLKLTPIMNEVRKR